MSDADTGEFSPLDSTQISHIMTDKDYYESWRPHLKESDEANLVRFLQQLQSKLLEIGSHTQEDTEILQYLLDSFLLDVTAAIMDKDLAECAEYHEELCEFIERLLWFMCEIIQWDLSSIDKVFLDILSRIFDRSARFHFDYIYNEVSVTDFPSDHEAWDFFSQYDTNIAQLPSDEYAFVHPLFVKLVNSFLDMKGMSRIYTRLQSGSVDIQDVCYYLFFLSQLSPFFTSEFIDKFCISFVTVVFKRIDSISKEALRNIDKKMVDDCLKTLCKIASYGSHDLASMVQKEIELFTLKQALVYLESSQLEKKVAGLRDLRIFVKIVNAKELIAKKAKESGVSYEVALENYESENKQVTEDFDPSSVRYSWMRSHVLADWFHQNKVLETLLEADNHSHIIRRSFEIFVFLANKDFLEENHIDLLWSHTTSKHESDIGAIFETIQKICFSLSSRFMIYLFEKIVAIPLNQHSESTIKLISAFTLVYMSRNQSAVQAGIKEIKSGTSSSSLIKYHFGLKLLWYCLQDEYIIPTNLQTIAIQRLNHALKTHGRQLRVLYVDMCLKNMQERKSLGNSLKVLNNILNAFPVQVGEAEDISRAEFIEFLEENHKLTNVIMNLVNITNERVNVYLLLLVVNKRIFRVMSTREMRSIICQVC